MNVYSLLSTVLLSSVVILITFRVTSYLGQTRQIESDLQRTQTELTVKALHDQNVELTAGLKEAVAVLTAAVTDKPVTAFQVAPTVEPTPASSFFEIEDDSEDYVLAEDGSNEIIGYDEDLVLLGLVPEAQAEAL